MVEVVQNFDVVRPGEFSFSANERKRGEGRGVDGVGGVEGGFGRWMWEEGRRMRAGMCES